MNSGFLLAAVFLLIASQSKAQTSPESESFVRDPDVLACQLSGDEFQKRKAVLEEKVFSKVKKVEELEDGYAFFFEQEGDQLITVVDYMLAENKCCPFFKQDLSILPNGEGFIWKLTGSEQVKELLDDMAEAWD